MEIVKYPILQVGTNLSMVSPLPTLSRRKCPNINLNVGSQNAVMLLTYAEQAPCSDKPAGTI